MILDFLCIVLAVIVRLLGNDRIQDNVEKVVFDRYLDLQKKKDNIKSQPYDLFLDVTSQNEMLKYIKK